MRPEPSWMPYTVTHESGMSGPPGERFAFNLPRERGEFDAFVASSHTATATHLHVGVEPSAKADEILATLAKLALPHLVGLGLHIARQGIPSESLRSVLSAPFFPALELLHLEGAITCAQLQMVISVVPFMRLRRLRLRMFEPIDDALAHALANAPSLGTLDELILWVNDGTAEQRLGAIIGASSVLTRLGHVAFRCLTEAGARAFLGARDWPSVLAELDLGGSSVGPGFCAELALARWSKLQRLCLHGNVVEDAGAAALAASASLRALTHLDLGTCRLSDVGLCEILTSHAFPELTFLDLNNNHRARPGPVVVALEGATGLTKLEMLDLGQCNIRQATAPFRGRANLPKLRWLKFGHQEYE